MAIFSIYTYQFQRINKQEELNLEFESDTPKACTDELWEQKQEAFGRLFDKGSTLEFKGNKDSNGNEQVYIHEVVYNEGNIIIMKFANHVKKKITNAHLKETEIDDYPNCYVVFDNRHGIQRMLIEKKNKAWQRSGDKPGTQRVADILTANFDRIFTPQGMHFISGDGPVYAVRDFWDEVKKYPQGISRVSFNFPAPNLGRLLTLADGIDAVRAETGGSYDADIKAPTGGVLALSPEKTHFESMVKLSSAGGYQIKAYPKGGTTCLTITGGETEQQAVTIELPDNLLQLLAVPQLFTRENLELLVTALNSIKNVYE